VADATDDYPIPRRVIITTCTAEQIMAAARDFAPIYYQRYIIDTHNEPPEVQQAAIDNAHYFDALSRNVMMTTTPQLSTDLTQRTRDLSAAPKMKTLIHLMKTATTCPRSNHSPTLPCLRGNEQTYGVAPAAPAIS
jgi:hypothetical protein